MRHFFILSFFFAAFFQARTQFTLSGTYDGYVGVSKKGITSLPFMVSHAKIGTYDINLLELELRYTRKAWTAQFSPAIGSYMQNNYALETPLRRYIYESYLQYAKGKNELAIGTFSSPYTQETPRGVDQLSASRSLSAEYVPYYVSGLRWTRSWTKQLKTQFFVTNGWQRLMLSGVRPSLGLLVQYEKKNWKYNWSHFYGDLAPYGKLTPALALNRQRVLQEFNVGYTNNNWTFQSCVYAGLQKQNGDSELKYWLQGNLQASYALNAHLGFNARSEIFYDPNQVVFSAVGTPFSSLSLGFMYRIGPALQFGQEFRYFLAKHTEIPVYYSFLRLKF
jgi:hypothetical protein